MLTDLAPPEAPAGAIAEVAAELRLPFGFADDEERRASLASSVAAAIATVERRTGRVLLRRGFRLRVAAWEDRRAHPLPLAPVASIDALVVEDATGLRSGVDVATLRLEEAAFRPQLVARPPRLLPPIPLGGFAEIILTAGFGPALDAAPADLRRAAILIAAGLHDPAARASADAAANTLLDPWRRIRL